MLTEFDYILILILAFFTIRGFFYGFIAQVSSLTGWFLSIWLIYRYSTIVAGYIPNNWPGGFLTQLILAVLLIFLITSLFFSSLGRIMHRLVSLTNLRGFDSFLGLICGALRSVLVILLIFICLHITPLPRYLFWQNAFTRPAVESVLAFLRPHLPNFLNELISITLGKPKLMDDSTAEIRSSFNKI